YQRQIDQLSQDHAKLVGTNNYVDASEILANSESPVATNRFAQAFEYLREKGQASDLKIILLRYGNLKQFKARTDFVRGFIAVAGIDAIESPIFTAVDKLEYWV